jgi:photosystem II stability/assembly factor-like uncharacterized protein
VQKQIFILVFLAVLVSLPADPRRASASKISPSSSTLPDATDSTAMVVAPEPVDIQGFHLVSEDAGWLLLDRSLYWTQDGGQSWNSITPANLEPYAIRAVSFLDAQSGWLILSAAEQANPFVIAQTSDGGKTWESRALSLFAPGDVTPARCSRRRMAARTGRA